MAQIDPSNRRAPYAVAVLRAIAIGLCVVAAARLGSAIITSWNFYGGELLAAFPGHLVLEWLNPAVYAEAPAPWVPATWVGAQAWFYGPFHHLAYLPLLAVSPSLASFWHALLVTQIVAICAGLAALARVESNLPANHRFFFFFLVIGLTFNQFAVLDNLRLRHTEILEFVLLLGALWALYRGREAAGGALMALAALTKLLPAVFFLLLPVRRLTRGIRGYAAATAIVVVLAQLLLGWENYSLFQARVANAHGLPTVAAMRGEEPFTEPSDQRGSLYTFLLAPYYRIEFPSGHASPTVRRATSNFLVPNLAFAGIVLFVCAMTIVALRRAGTDWLFSFGLLGCVTLIASPRCNPHYYVFPLFGLFWFARRFLERAAADQVTRSDVTIAVALAFVMLAFGSVVPFGVVDRLFGLVPTTYFSMLAVYGIYGAATFVLWALLMYTRLKVDGTPRMIGVASS